MSTRSSTFAEQLLSPKWSTLPKNPIDSFQPFEGFPQSSCCQEFCGQKWIGIGFDCGKSRKIIMIIFESFNIYWHVIFSVVHWMSTWWKLHKIVFTKIFHKNISVTLTNRLNSYYYYGHVGCGNKHGLVSADHVEIISSNSEKVLPVVNVKKLMDEQKKTKERW